MHCCLWQSEWVIAHEFMLHSSAHGHISLVLFFAASLYFLLSIFTPPSVQHHASVMPPLVIAFLPTHRAPKLRFFVSSIMDVPSSYFTFLLMTTLPLPVCLHHVFLFHSHSHLVFMYIYRIRTKPCTFVVIAIWVSYFLFHHLFASLFYSITFRCCVWYVWWSSCLLPPRPINRSLNHVALVFCISLAGRLWWWILCFLHTLVVPNWWLFVIVSAWMSLFFVMLSSHFHTLQSHDAWSQWKR